MAPYLRNIWPKTNDRGSRSIAKDWARVCIAGARAFREALELVEAWLQPFHDTDLILEGLLEAEICEQFPREALKFLDAISDEQTHWPVEELRRCLNTIRIAAPELEDDPRFIRLRAYLWRQGTDLD